jgi:hypothetical protein
MGCFLMVRVVDSDFLGFSRISRTFCWFSVDCLLRTALSGRMKAPPTWGHWEPRPSGHRNLPGKACDLSFVKTVADFWQLAMHVHH